MRGDDTVDAHRRADLNRLADIVRTIVQGLVDDESAVHVEVLAEQMHTNLKLIVADGDFGKVVGRGGQNAEALRSIMHAVGNKLRLPACTLFIQDPDPSQRGRRWGLNTGFKRY